MKFRSNRLIPTNEWRKPSNNNKEKTEKNKIRKEIKNKKTTRSETVFKQIARTFVQEVFQRRSEKCVDILQIMYGNLLHEGGKNYIPL